jgi:hypothetical protein
LDFTTQQALNEEFQNNLLGYDKQMAKAIELLNN